MIYEVNTNVEMAYLQYIIYIPYVYYGIILREDLWNLDIGVCVGDCERTGEVGNLLIAL